jgi:CTD nuclear envelope phosphatase 1
VINEEGLPFHEIRELPDGSTIGPLPPSTTDGSGVKEEDAEEYWSETARQRREALRRRIFNEGSDTEEDDAASSDEESSSALPAKATPTPPPEPVVPSIVNAPPSPPSSPSPPASPAHGSRRPSSGVLPGKSILKPPARKKSVSFDESVPQLPDSPDLLGGKKTMGFPLPSTETNEFDPKPVPVINPPRLPGGKDQPFAGFKKGFLGTPRASGVEKISEPAAVVEPEAVKARKTSLFAQRLAQQTVKESTPVPSPVAPRDVAGMAQSPSTGTPEPKTAVSLPKLSENKPMASMKSAVVENPPEIKPLPSNTSAPVRRDVREHQPGEDPDFEDDDDDLDEEDDEDEYDLDDALLAREVALEYHRRRAYARLNPEEDGNVMSVEGRGEEGGGDVMLALPQVDASGGPMIVNPTPDDIRRFVRVGRLQNGNLVLAPGEQGWSEDEEDVDDEEKELRRQRRAEVKRQLLGEEPAHSPIPGPKVQEKEDQPVQLPPTILTEKEMPTAAVGEVKESLPKVIEVEQPKKVSRFKQARMAAGQQ